MPIYEYECTQCGRVEEVLQNFSDKPLTRCPSCAGKLQKLVSQSTFHLKGTGWYATDYTNRSAKATKPSAKNQKSDSADTASSGAASQNKNTSKADSS